jgi:DNA adenine methylase
VAKPIIKWAGGKTKLLPELVKHLPSTYGRYYEPFIGGAALFFHLEPADAVLGDLNPNLINVYRTLAQAPGAVIDELRSHANWHRTRPNWYYEVRAAWNESGVGDIWRAAAFLYLNRTCFNGLWRVNKKGEFNVPKGDYKNPTICDAENLAAAAVVLSRAAIRHGSYALTVEDAKAGDLVYFDPPYDGTFTGYTDEGFNRTAQRDLAWAVRDLAERGCHVVVSNSDTPLIRELYADFTIHSINAPRAINSDGEGRQPAPEVIVVAGD